VAWRTSCAWDGFRPVHVKTIDAHEQGTMLSARATLMTRLKDIENSVRGLFRGDACGSRCCCAAAGMHACERPSPATRLQARRNS
jgi:hypothetical protein